MAVTRRRNAIVQEEQESSDSNVPPHLRHLDEALGDGDADALRRALGNTTYCSIDLCSCFKIGRVKI